MVIVVWDSDLSELIYLREGSTHTLKVELRLRISKINKIKVVWKIFKIIIIQLNLTMLLATIMRQIRCSATFEDGVAKKRTRFCGRQRNRVRFKARRSLVASMLALLQPILLVRQTGAIPTNLIDPSLCTISVNAGTLSANFHANIASDDNSSTSTWSSGATSLFGTNDQLTFTFNSPTNVGAVILSTPDDLTRQEVDIYVGAYGPPATHQNCYHDPQIATYTPETSTNFGTTNCGFEAADYLQISFPASGVLQLDLTNMYVFDSIDIAQFTTLADITIENTWKKGSYDFIIGSCPITESEQRTEIENTNQGGIPYLQLELPYPVSGSVEIIFTHDDAGQNIQCESILSSGAGATGDCSPLTQVLGSSAFYAQATGAAIYGIKISEISGDNVRLNSLAVLPTDPCAVALSGQYDSADDTEHDLAVGVSTPILPELVFYNYSFCSFVIASVDIYIQVDPSVSFTPYTGSTVFEVAGGVLTITETSSLLIDTTELFLVQATLDDDGGWQTGGFTISVSYVNPCGDTAIDFVEDYSHSTLFDVTSQLRVGPMPDSVGTSNASPLYCGERQFTFEMSADSTLGLADTPVTFITVSGTQPDDLQFDFSVFTAADVGTHTITTIVTLDNIPDITISFDIELTIRCPLNFSLTQLTTMSPTSFTQQYLDGSMTFTVSDWEAEPACWIYSHFKMSGRGNNHATDFTYDPLTSEVVSLGIPAYDDGVSTTFTLVLQFVSSDGLESPTSAALNDFDILMVTVDCRLTILSAPLLTINLEHPVDGSAQVFVDVLNSIATEQENAAFCGDLSTTYVETVSESTLLYLTVGPISTLSDLRNGFNIDFSSVDSRDGNPGDLLTLEFTSFLSDYPSAGTIVITVELTLACPEVFNPALTYSVQLTPERLLGYNFNFNTNPHLFTMSAWTLDYENLCYSIITYYILDQTLTIWTDGFFDDTINHLSVQILDSTGYLDNTFIFTLYVTVCSIDSPSDCSNLEFDSVTISFADPPNAAQDCPTTVLDPLLALDIAARSTYVFAEPIITQQLTIPGDTLGAETYHFYCGDRTFTYELLDGTQAAFVSTQTPAAGDRLIIEEIFTDDILLIGTHSVILTVGLADYPEVTPIQATIQFTINCPAALAYTFAHTDFVATHVFGSGSQSLTVNSVTEATTGSGCFDLVSEAHDVLGSPSPDVVYDWLISTVTYDNLDISVLDTTVTFPLMIVRPATGASIAASTEIGTLTIDYPSGCTTTSFEAYSAIGIVLGAEDPIRISTYAKPTTLHDISLSICGSRTYAFVGTVPSWIILTDLSDSQFQVSVDPSLAENGSYSFGLQWTLDSHSGVVPLTHQVGVQIVCGLPEFVTLSDMAQTAFTYDVLSNVPLEIQLPVVQQLTTCISITDSNIFQVDDGSSAIFDSVDWNLQTFSLWTGDSSLLGRTIEYKWLVDTDAGVENLELARFSVTYTSAKVGFDPPLSSIIQIYKQPWPFYWTFELPSIVGVDEQGRNPVLQMGLDGVSTIGMALFEGALEIEDIGKPELPVGEFSFWASLQFDLDEAGTVFFNRTTTVIVHDYERRQKVNTTANETAVAEDDQESIDNGRQRTELEQKIFDWRTLYQGKEREMVDADILWTFRRPVATLAYIEQNGEVHLQFDRQMRVLPDLAMITDCQVQIGDELPVNCFEVEIIKGEDSEPANLQYEWTVKTMNKRKLVLQLKFKTARYVSMEEEPDMVRITVRDPYLFIGTNNVAIGTYREQNIGSEGQRTLAANSDDGSEEQTPKQEGEVLIFEKELPPQIQLDSVDFSIMEIINGVFTGAKVFVVSNFILNLLISASLNQLWSMINTQQLIVMLVLFHIQMPANAGIFFRNVMEIAAFDFYEVDDLVHGTFNIEPSEPISAQFAALGLQSQYFLVNMGTMVFFILIYILLLCVMVPLLGMCRGCSERIERWFQRLQRHTKWNSLIRLMNESFMVVVICLLINIGLWSTETVGLATMSILCIVVIALTVILPAVFILHLYRNFSTLNEKHVQAKFGELYGDLKLATGRVVLLQPAFFLFRRYLLGISIMVFRQELIFQLYLMAAQVIFQLIIVNLNVFAQPGQKRIENFNEWILLNVLYTIITFSPWIDDVDVKFLIGYATIGIVASHFLINLMLIFFASSSQCKWTCKRKIVKRKYLVERKKLQARLAANHPMQKLRLKKLRKQKRSNTVVPVSSSFSQEDSSVMSVEERTVTKAYLAQADRDRETPQPKRLVPTFVQTKSILKDGKMRGQTQTTVGATTGLSITTMPQVREKRHYPEEEEKETRQFEYRERRPASDYLGIAAQDPSSHVTININQVFYSDNLTDQQRVEQVAQRPRQRSPIHPAESPRLDDHSRQFQSTGLQNHGGVHQQRAARFQSTGLGLQRTGLQSMSLKSVSQLISMQDEKSMLPSAASLMAPGHHPYQMPSLLLDEKSMLPSAASLMAPAVTPGQTQFSSDSSFMNHQTRKYPITFTEEKQSLPSAASFLGGGSLY